MLNPDTVKESILVYLNKEDSPLSMHIIIEKVLENDIVTIRKCLDSLVTSGKISITLDNRYLNRPSNNKSYYLWNMEDLKRYTGLRSRASIFNWIKKDILPRPIIKGRWSAEEVKNKLFTQRQKDEV
jgi:predicted DNA-binding transcriptional regulator AlpA